MHMDTPISREPDPEGIVPQGRMADTPRSLAAPIPGFLNLKGLRQSTRYGILLYLMQSPDYSLSNEQRLWIIYRARKLSEAELLRAGRFSDDLNSRQDIRKRMRKDIEETFIRVPRLLPKQIPEKRRIGIGYRDKGALRPLHQKRILGERVFWDEDVQYMLPLTYTSVGKWISADEVVSQTGNDLLNLVLHTIQSMCSSKVFSSPTQSYLDRVR